MLLTSSQCLCAQSNIAAGSETVVAEIDGQQITLGKVEPALRAQLFQAQQQYYLAERAALERWIDNQLLANEAARQQITVAELVDRNINSQVKDPTDDQMQVFYEGMKTDQPFEPLRDKILQHIRELRAAKIRSTYLQSLRRQAHALITFAPPAAQIAPGNIPVRGSVSAPVHIIEFGDYECPYCQRVFPVVQQLLSEYGAKMSFSFRDYPLPMHAEAPKAAEATHCAAAQGKFWEFYNVLFNSKKLAIPDLKEEASKLSLNTEAFNKCLDSGEQAANVAKDVAEAQRLQLTGTPTFFINGRFFDGPLTYEALRTAVEHELLAVSKESATITTSSLNER